MKRRWGRERNRKPESVLSIESTFFPVFRFARFLSPFCQTHQNRKPETPENLNCLSGWEAR